MLVEGDVGTKTLVPENHLTTHEQEVLEGIKKNPTAMRDVMLEHGYTGTVDNDHFNDVVGTVMISLVSKRLLYLNEFRKGLDLFGLPALMQANSLLCKQLFVTGHGGKAPDANYVVSCLIPCYSEAGSSRRAIEEEMVDHFQDLLISLENKRVPGYSEDLAWNDGEDSIPGTGDDGTKEEAAAQKKKPPHKRKSRRTKEKAAAQKKSRRTKEKAAAQKKKPPHKRKSRRTKEKAAAQKKKPPHKRKSRRTKEKATAQKKKPPHKRKK